jgi:glycosyltransferase involved in cell wall biosynthesis
MGSDEPLVSIGMIVRNAAPYIREALDSLLAQDFHDFELIISDNASEDDTQAICLTYAAKDARIRYYRSEEDMGSVENCSRVYRKSLGKYFMLAGGHDLWAPTYLSRCVEVLEQNPSVVLCCSDTMLIDTDGKPLGLMPGRLDTRHFDSLSRAILFLWGHLYGNAIYGLIRSSTLKQTRLFRFSIGPDEVLLIELSMLGEFVQIPEPLYYRRRTYEAENRDQQLRRYRENLYPKNKRNRLWLPFCQWVYETLLAVKAGPISRGGKVVLGLNVVFWFITKFWRDMSFDLRYVARFLVG